MASRDEVMAALAAVPGPDGKTPLPESGADFRPHHPGRQGLSRHRRRSRPGEGAGVDARQGRGGDQGGARGHERGRDADRRGRPRDRRGFAWACARARRRPAASAGARRPLDRAASPASGTSSRSRPARAASASRRSPAISPSASPSSASWSACSTQTCSAHRCRSCSASSQARAGARREEASPARGLRRQGDVDRLPGRGRRRR